MIIKEIETALNAQIKLEGMASLQYLAMSSWAEVNGFSGVAKFFYGQAEEEREHMVKLMAFVNERGGVAKVPAFEEPVNDFKSLNQLFEFFLEKEQVVTNHVNEIIYNCLQFKDYTVHNFMQWYVAEQIEEESVATTLLDKLKIIGSDKGGLYMFDRDIETIIPVVGSAE